VVLFESATDVHCAGDSDHAKAVFLEAVLRGGNTPTSDGCSELSLRRVLARCSRHCPVTVCHGDKQHYVVCVAGNCDPVVLENADAVEQLTAQMCTDSEVVDEPLSWLTVHLPSDLLTVTRLLDRPFCERSILCFAHVSFFYFFFPSSLVPTSANRHFGNFST